MRHLYLRVIIGFQATCIAHASEELNYHRRYVIKTHYVCQSSHDSMPLRYSVTLVSKKFFSFLRSIISLIHGKGFFAS